MPLTVAIVGRPNVGKSTLFNRLVGRRIALVDDQPGVTRDLREGEARLGDLRFAVVDTAGLEEPGSGSGGGGLQGRMRALVERAVDMADLCILVIDARAGVIPADRDFALFLRKRNAEVVVAANKAESAAADAGVIESHGLGFGEPVRLSAEHGEGMSDLHAILAPRVDALAGEQEDLGEFTDAGTPPGTGEGGAVADGDLRPTGARPGRSGRAGSRPLQVAVVGRPNVGKSTLVNRIAGDDRLLTGPEAGLTRDAISIHLDWGGIPMRVFDTAGMRRKAKVREKLERLSVADGLRAVRFAEVVVVLLDAAIPFEQQDLRIADLAEREGRAVVVAANKWDLQRGGDRRLGELRESLERLLPQLRGAPLVPVSATTGRGLDQLRAEVLRMHETWNRRVPTARLNRWLADMVGRHPPPAPQGRRIRMRYATQVSSRPPSFVVMCSDPDRIPESYTRYLVNGLREEFELPGTPIRLFLRSRADRNPYKDRKKAAPSKLRKHLAPTRGPKGRRSR